MLLDCSEKHGTFSERLLEALERHLGLRDSVCFAGSTVGEALLTSAAAARGRARPMCEPYLERYAQHDIFRTPAAERRMRCSGAAALWEFSDDEVSRCPLYIEEFLGRFGSPWLFGIKLDSADGIPLFVSILNFDGPIPHDDLTRLTVLRRLLRSESVGEDGPRSHDASPSLTTREREIARLVESGKSNVAIAEALGIRVDTVKKHLTSMFLAYGVESRTQLAIALHDGRHLRAL